MNTIPTFSFTVLFMLSVAAGAFAQPPSQIDQESTGSAPERIRNQVDNWLRSDQNNDGKLAKDETSGLQRRFFDRNDANKDGFLDRSELEALSDRLAKNRASRGSSAGRPDTLTTDELRKRIPDGVTLVPDISYREGHPRWKLDLLMPSDRGTKPRPAIVFVHGGGWRNGDKRKSAFIDPAIAFASKGYVCISVNYRFLSDVQMMDTIADVKCAVRWLRAHADKYNVDPDRLGAYGNSAGAHLVSMLGVCPPSAKMEGDGPWQEHSSMVQAVCASATPTSFMIPMNNRAGNQNQRGSRATTNAPSELSEELRKKISPAHYVSSDAPPFLLIHDESDQTVLVNHAKTFVKALELAGAKDVTFKLYDNKSGHGAMQRNIAETGPLREAFFGRTLRGE